MSGIALVNVSRAQAEPAPEGCRPDINAVAACLTLDTWDTVVKAAQAQGVDLRDLTDVARFEDGRLVGQPRRLTTPSMARASPE